MFKEEPSCSKITEISKPTLPDVSKVKMRKSSSFTLEVIVGKNITNVCGSKIVELMPSNFKLVSYKNNKNKLKTEQGFLLTIRLL